MFALIKYKGLEITLATLVQIRRQCAIKSSRVTIQLLLLVSLLVKLIGRSIRVLGLHMMLQLFLQIVNMLTDLLTRLLDLINRAAITIVILVRISVTFLVGGRRCVMSVIATAIRVVVVVDSLAIAHMNGERIDRRVLDRNAPHHRLVIHHRGQLNCGVSQIRAF